MFKLLKYSKLQKPIKLVNLRTVTDYRIATQTQGKTQHKLKNAPDDRDTLKLGDGLDDVNTQLLATGKEPKEDSYSEFKYFGPTTSILSFLEIFRIIFEQNFGAEPKFLNALYKFADTQSTSSRYSC